MAVFTRLTKRFRFVPSSSVILRKYKLVKVVVVFEDYSEKQNTLWLEKEQLQSSPIQTRPDEFKHSTCTPTTRQKFCHHCNKRINVYPPPIQRTKVGAGCCSATNGYFKTATPGEKNKCLCFFRKKKIGGLISDFFPICILIETTIFYLLESASIGLWLSHDRPRLVVHPSLQCHCVTQSHSLPKLHTIWEGFELQRCH